MALAHPAVREFRPGRSSRAPALTLRRTATPPHHGRTRSRSPSTEGTRAIRCARDASLRGPRASTRGRCRPQIQRDYWLQHPDSWLQLPEVFSGLQNWLTAMTSVLHVLWHGIRDALLMGWQVWWALALGFFVSAVVQAWIPREKIESSLGTDGPGPLARATALGACSAASSPSALRLKPASTHRRHRAVTSTTWPASS